MISSSICMSTSNTTALLRNLNKKLREVRALRNKIENGEIREELLTGPQR